MQQGLLPERAHLLAAIFWLCSERFSQALHCKGTFLCASWAFLISQKALRLGSKRVFLSPASKSVRSIMVCFDSIIKQSNECQLFYIIGDPVIVPQKTLIKASTPEQSVSSKTVWGSVCFMLIMNGAKYSSLACRYFLQKGSWKRVRSYVEHGGFQF